ncbi:cysteine proteinase, partial [Punctularia strigosozonata HHB-11173 SS5]|uniref:cysteine proteinase n=1 Tax=Punctularia strigosozonata (strain HHB-11173) TaxID=741275 RepID=UPI00044183B7
MAIVKWKFGQAPSQTTQPEPPKQAPVQIVTADGKQFGLENFGNTCYANSVLQALYFCSPLRDLVIQSPDSAAGHEDPASFLPSPTVLGQQVRHKPDRKPSATHTPSRPADPTASQLTASSSGSTSATLFSALRALFLHIAQNPQDKGTVAPRAFIEKLRELNELFRSTMHQDAHEFLNYVLNKIVDELEEERKRNADGKVSNSVATLATTRAPSTSYSLPSASTLVHRLFEGTLTSETRCLTCETVSSRDESFLDLSVDIEQNSSITACLRQFSASEMLCQRNKFFCDSCCDLQEAEKRMKIKRLPNVLALHLKRFKYQEDVGRYIKLAYRVAFPLELRLFNTVDDAQDPDRLYKLFAIVVHIGNGPHHGHYITIVKAANPNAPGQWLVFDDDNVDTIKESDIPKYYGDSNSGSAYVLFYQ